MALTLTDKKALHRFIHQPHLKLVSNTDNTIPFFQFSTLSKYLQLIHGIFTRHGGISKSPYATLNVGEGVGDRPKNVEYNRERIRKAMGGGRLIYLNQVHGQDILLGHRENPHELICGIRADAMITNIPHVSLMVKQADCQAIILFDPIKGVISNIHCGWRGNGSNIIGAVVKKMNTDFGCRECDLIAGISPSLGPCCAEFKTYRDLLGHHFYPFMVEEGYFNLWEMSRVQLLEAGLREENIHVAEICSKCNTDVFYSYRAEGTTGRSATVVMLKSIQK